MKKVMPVFILMILMCQLTGCIFKSSTAQYSPNLNPNTIWESSDGVFYFESDEKGRCTGTLTLEDNAYEVYIMANQTHYFGVYYLKDEHLRTKDNVLIEGVCTYKKNTCTVEILLNNIKDKYDVKKIEFIKIQDATESE